MSRPSRRAVTAILAAAPLVALAACSSSDTGASDASDGNDGGTRSVETPNGAVEIPNAPERIVVLNSALTGYLFDLGLPVAATVPTLEGDDFSDLWRDGPERSGTDVLPSSPDSFDLEAILNADPDLIIAGGWGLPYHTADDVYDDLSDIAPTVLVDKQLKNWEEQFSFLAVDVFDQQEIHEELIAAYEERAEEVAASIELPEQPVSFIYTTPDKQPYLVLDEYPPQVFLDVGFEIDPIGSEQELEPYTEGGDAAPLSIEQLGQQVDSPSVFIMGFNQETFSVADLESEPVWKDLPAFQDDRAFDLPYWALRHDYDQAFEVLDVIEQEFGA